MSTYISRTARSTWLRQSSRWTALRALGRNGARLQCSQWQQMAPASTEAVQAQPVTTGTTRYQPSVDVPLFRVDLDKRCLLVQVGKNVDTVRRFQFLYLRDACSCARCVDPSTKQKTFQTSDIPTQISLQKLTVREDGGVDVQWSSDVPGFSPDHISTYPLSFFRQNWTRVDREMARYNNRPQTTWGKTKMEKAVKWIPYDSFLKSDQTLHQALTHLSEYGLVFLSDVLSSEEAVVNIGTRIGPLRDSFYGRTWDVKSVPNAKNVAYTHQNLGLHMDLLYMQNPPGLQFLHCLRATCSGGNSLFSDSYRAASRLRHRHAAHFSALEHFPVTYHYRNAGQHYHYTRPTIELDRYAPPTELPEITAVNWAPPFQAPFEIDIGVYGQGRTLRAYHYAAREFAALVEAEDALFELKLEEGQCVIFNNRRVLHARRAFDIGTGERWLKGAYLDNDVFLSKLRVLSEEFEGEKPEWVARPEGVKRPLINRPDDLQ